jgi:hypothetical protein
MEYPIKLQTSHSYFSIYYDLETVQGWQSFWNRILKMAYLREGVVESMIAIPCDSRDNEYYKQKIPSNYHDITIDHAWKQFSGEPCVVLELKKIFVPKDLFSSIGIFSFFNYCFPNCEIVYWE